MDSIRFTLLTSVDIAGDKPLTITARKVRTVLAVLLLAAGRRVPTDRLVEEVWSNNPPASAVKNLQLYVRRLRRALEEAAPGGGQRLRRIADGYSLRAEEAEVDLYAAEAIAARAERTAERGALTDAAGLLDLVLSGWSDHPLGGVTGSPGLLAAAERLRERRLAILERWCELALATGRYGEVADRLRPVVVRHPLRERPHALLITAMGRVGQRAEAIEVFHRLRRELSHELAIDPGPAVRAAYQELLTA